MTNEGSELPAKLRKERKSVGSTTYEKSNLGNAPHLCVTGTVVQYYGSESGHGVLVLVELSE